LPYVQVRDVLDNLSKLHGSLHDHYQRQAALASDDRVNTLLTNAAKRSEQAVGLFDVSDESNVLEHWMQFDPTEAARKHLTDVRVDPQRPVDDVVCDLIDVEEAVLKALEHLAQQTTAPRLKHILEKVRDLQHTRTRQLAWVQNAMESQEGVSPGQA